MPKALRTTLLSLLSILSLFVFAQNTGQDTPGGDILFQRDPDPGTGGAGDVLFERNSDEGEEPSADQDTPAEPNADQEETDAENAQDGAREAAEQRVINIDFSGGSQRSESLRYGPLVYTHADPEGLTATVSNLTIYAQNAELSAPDEVLIAQAEGQREATFTGGVRVVRDRLTATGPDLVYSESTGLGVIPDETSIVVQPAEEDDAAVNISADEVTFDVDTDVSVSRGNVTLTNGSQSAQAQELTFEEGRDLARLRSQDEQVTARRENEDGVLVITADVIRTNTTSDTLLATGNVTIVDGDITSSGDTVYFNDANARAEVLGSPATSVDEARGVTLSGARLEQRTDLNVVRVLNASALDSFDPANFDLTNEQQ